MSHACGWIYVHTIELAWNAMQSKQAIHYQDNLQSGEFACWNGSCRYRPNQSLYGLGAMPMAFS